MSQMPICYRVVVQGNVVSAIEPLVAPSAEHVATTPLEVSMLLARNYQMRGCLDGTYHLPDVEMARQVAVLSLDFMAKLIERSVASLNAASLHGQGWTNPFAGSGAAPPRLD
jgi:hypothetical protein